MWFGSLYRICDAAGQRNNSQHEDEIIECPHELLDHDNRIVVIVRRRVPQPEQGELCENAVHVAHADEKEDLHTKAEVDQVHGIAAQIVEDGTSIYNQFISGGTRVDFTVSTASSTRGRGGGRC